MGDVQTVRGHVDLELDDSDIQPYLDAAQREVDRRQDRQDVDLDDPLHDELVALLAAHRIRTLRRDEREVASQSDGDLSADYAPEFGAGLHATTPGQHAKRISPTGFFGGATYTITRDDVEGTDE